MNNNSGKDKFEQIVSDVKSFRKQDTGTEIEDNYIKIVLFTLNDDYYAFIGKNIKEVLPYEEITYIPGCPDFVYGIINVRGDIESVLNIHKLIGLPESQPTQKTRIAIAEGSQLRSGILIDSIEDVVDILEDAVQPPISTLEESIKKFVLGKINYDRKIVTIMDVEKIFTQIQK